MGRPAGLMKELIGRSMKSPGAPAHRREVEREFWRENADGVTSEQAAAIGTMGRFGVDRIIVPIYEVTRPDLEAGMAAFATAIAR